MNTTTLLLKTKSLTQNLKDLKLYNYRERIFRLLSKETIVISSNKCRSYLSRYYFNI